MKFICVICDEDDEQIDRIKAIDAIDFEITSTRNDVYGNNNCGLKVDRDLHAPKHILLRHLISSNEKNKRFRYYIKSYLKVAFLSDIRSAKSVLKG